MMNLIYLLNYENIKLQEETWQAYSEHEYGSLVAETYTSLVRNIH
jgi:hypothetical protein